MAIPAGVARIGNGVFGDGNALKVIQLDSGNPAFTLIDGVLYTKDRSELVMYPNPSATVFFTVRRAGEGNTFRHELADRISSAP